MTGANVTTLWQSSQTAVVVIWAVGLPTACTPLWQLAQLPEMLSWLKLAGIQAAVVWQLSHVLLAVMCAACLPVAVVPLWQLEHVPMTWR